ncbi:MAG TPA: o-succinylbenzoate synthase [Cyclobacteriaceae bacterium]|nr:o-succinylbenzoate synthase [Cyclobacteriaceae bacterium]
MALQASFTKKVFHFNFTARTSRGRMVDRTSWFIKVWDETKPDVFGIGECAPLPGLSIDAKPDYEEVLQRVVAQIPSLSLQANTLLKDAKAVVPPGYPSIVFGLETALIDLKNGGERILFNNSFIQAKPIPINGLVWMGDLDVMLQQASIKIEEGFKCIKIKIGGLNFEKECDIIHYIRKKYFRDDIELRLDANGSFKPEDALYKLYDLAKYKIHSIEQPIKPGRPEMEELCRKSPIPIVLDEELIGVESADDKKRLLERIKPNYIILKPSLIGGIQSSEEWISIAEAQGINWWMTSALESNIGLNAICQFTANYPVTIPQGLGTGMLYDDNFESPLEVVKGEIQFNPKLAWDLAGL